MPEPLKRLPDDKLLQATCEQIVNTVMHAIDSEDQMAVHGVHIPEGTRVGRQITIDATEKGGLLNRCRLSLLNPDIAPAEEVLRIEYEHDKEGPSGVHRVYSVQSVRRKGRELVFVENFMADKPEMVREQDYRPILSEAYAQKELKSLQDWTKYRAWQRQEARKQK